MDNGNKDANDFLLELNEKLFELVKQFVVRINPSVSPFLTKNEIQKIMGWTSVQFRYRIETLKQYGLILDGNQYKMPYSGFKLYVDSLGEDVQVSQFL